MRSASLTISQQHEAIALYQKGLSARQVAEHFNVKIDAIYYPLRRFKIPRRTASESNRLVFEAKPLSFEIKTHLSADEERLKLAAVMVYWAEGYKIGHSVDFANSDPGMALLFRKFLKDICQVDERRLQCKLYCYQGQDVAGLIDFWSSLLDIAKTQFTRPYVTESSSGPRGPRMVHGLIHVCYSDKRLLKQILRWIDEYMHECVDGRVVNYTSL